MTRSRLLIKALGGASALVAASVLLLSAVFLVRFHSAFRRQFELRAEAQANSVAAQCPFDLLVGNRSGVQALARAALGASADNIYVSIEDADGVVLATAQRPSKTLPQAAASPQKLTIRELTAGGEPVIEADVPVFAEPGSALPGVHNSGAEYLGRVRLGMSLDQQRAILLSTMRYVLVAALIILVIALAFYYGRVRALLDPILELARAAELIGSGTTDTIVLRKRTNDEVGTLVTSFNSMVAQIAERTRQLNEQVDAKERARAELAQAQRRLVDLSRQAGMAEVASSVLHNAGNVLNSINVSAAIVAAKIKESRVSKLKPLTGMLSAHRDGLEAFLSSDPKGQRVLPYLDNLAVHLEKEQDVVLSELDQLTAHIGHIKQIISTQQNYARVSGVLEQFDLRELVDDAIRITEPGMSTRKITILRHYEDVPPVLCDKHQVLQIVLNLLRNARQAVEDSLNPEHVIRVRIQAPAQALVSVEVKDSGVGIRREDLARIFAHGFTTKAGGHGFGLHSGALAARQLGGSLTAASDGPGLGATFTLELNIDGPKRTGRSEVRHEYVQG